LDGGPGGELVPRIRRAYASISRRAVLEAAAGSGVDDRPLQSTTPPMLILDLVILIAAGHTDCPMGPQ
jgi:hypothetical protein